MKKGIVDNMPWVKVDMNNLNDRSGFYLFWVGFYICLISGIISLICGIIRLDGYLSLLGILLIFLFAPVCLGCRGTCV